MFRASSLATTIINSSDETSEQQAAPLRNFSSSFAPAKKPSYTATANNFFYSAMPPTALPFAQVDVFTSVAFKVSSSARTQLHFQRPLSAVRVIRSRLFLKLMA
jgi:hypothetical protein